MNAYQWVAVAWLALVALSKVAIVGEVRKPVTSQEAVGALVVAAALIYCVVHA